jgi:hypothetical protein
MPEQQLKWQLFFKKGKFKNRPCCRLTGYGGIVYDSGQIRLIGPLFALNKI